MADLIHKTISKGRKTIVFGMPWYTVEEEESPRKAGASLAQSVANPFDLIVTRKGETSQFGLARTTEGAKSGAVSAAAIVSEIVHTESWIYVLEIDTSIWICCGRDGYILPAGDRVYDNRDEARRAFQQLNPPSFKKVYLPESWKSGDGSTEIASDTEETDILEFIEYAAPKWGKLIPISPLGLILQVSSLVVLLGVIGLVASNLLGSGNDPTSNGLTPEQIQAARERLALQQREERLSRYAALDADRPWHNMAPTSKVFSGCMAGIRAFPADPVGYRIASVKCDESGVEAEVKRTTGYPSWLREWAESYENLQVSASSNGETGYISRPLGRIDPRGPEDLARFEDISETLLQYGQIEGASVNVTTPAAALVASEPEYTPYYALSNFKIETTRPAIWRPFFLDTPGFSIASITYNTETQTYTIQGDLYVPNL